MELRYTSLSQLKNLTDLFHVELMNVIKVHQLLLSFWQRFQGLRQGFATFFTFGNYLH